MKYSIELFKAGFLLANKNKLLFFISVLFSLTSLLEQNKSEFILLSYILLFLSISFEVSVPSFLDNSFQKRKTSLTDYINTLLVNSKRLIIPLFTLLILITISFILLVVFIAISGLVEKSPEGVKSVIDYLASNAAFKTTILILISISFPFVKMTYTYFTIEKKPLIQAFKSAITRFKRNYFLLNSIIISSILLSVLGFIFREYSLNTNIFLIINAYFSFVLTSVIYLFYKE